MTLRSFRPMFVTDAGPSEGFASCPAFLSGGVLFVRRAADGAWTAFSQHSGFQCLRNVDVERRWRDADRRFAVGESVTLTFGGDD